MMEVPILTAGEKVGVLTLRREGLYTVFEARLPPDRELTRLWVAGEGRSAYLGLMEPRQEGLWLRRRLSASAMRTFPSEIAYAATEEPVCAVEEPPEPPHTPPAEDEPGSAQAAPAATLPLPETAEPVPEADGLLWFSRPDGSLAAFDGERTLVALPASLRRREPGARLERIGGREYMVFRY